MCILMQCPGLVPSLKALKESFSMKEIPHLALIARRICVECIKLFHVRFPCIREYVLLLLDLQLVGKLGDDVIYQLVVRQGAQRIDVHVAEYDSRRCRSTAPAVSGHSAGCTSSGTSEQLCPPGRRRTYDHAYVLDGCSPNQSSLPSYEEGEAVSYVQARCFQT